MLSSQKRLTHFWYVNCEHYLLQLSCFQNLCLLTISCNRMRVCNLIIYHRALFTWRSLSCGFMAAIQFCHILDLYLTNCIKFVLCVTQFGLGIKISLKDSKVLHSLSFCRIQQQKVSYSFGQSFFFFFFQIIQQQMLFCQVMLNSAILQCKVILPFLCSSHEVSLDSYRLITICLSFHFLIFNHIYFFLFCGREIKFISRLTKKSGFFPLC